MTQTSINMLREQYCERIAASRVCRATSHSKSIVKGGRKREVLRADRNVWLRVRDIVNKSAFEKFCAKYGVPMNVDSFSMLFSSYWQDMFVFFTHLYTDRYKDLQKEHQEWLEYVIGYEVAREILERKVGMGVLAFADQQTYRVVKDWIGYKDDCADRCSEVTPAYSEADPTRPGGRRIIPGYSRQWRWAMGNVAKRVDKKIETNYEVYKALQQAQPLKQLPAGIGLSSWFQ